MGLNRFKLTRRVGARYSGSPTPSPTPGAGGLAAPVLVKTSASGANPMTFSFSGGGNIIGVYFRIQISTDAGFSTIIRDESIAIHNDHMTSSEMGFESLFGLPDGSLFVRASYERDDGGYSDYSNVITDNLNSLPLTNLIEKNRGVSTQPLTGDLLSLVGTVTNNNGYQGARSNSSKIATNTLNNKGYFETTWTSGANGGSSLIGLVNFDQSLSGVQPGNNANPGTSWPGGRYAYVSGSAVDLGNTNTVTSGDVLMLWYNALVGKIWYGKNGNWLSGNPTLSTPTGGHVIAAGPWHALVATSYNATATARFTASSQQYRGSLQAWGL